MKSNVDKFLVDLKSWKDGNLQASGILLVNGIQGSIRDQGLIDSSRMINDIQYQPKNPDNEIRVGTTIDNPPYPFFLNNGYVHVAHKRSAEEGANANGPQSPTVGPYHFMEKGEAAVEGDIRSLWSTWR